MRKVKWVAGLACVAAILLWLFTRVEVSESGNRGNDGNSSGPIEVHKDPTNRTNADSPPAPPGLGNVPPGSSPGNSPRTRATFGYAAVPANPGVLEFTNFPPDQVLDNVRSAFRAFTSIFNGNPIGTNPEITAALNGSNFKQAKFLREEDGLRINANGELIDPWGTPYFFHQLSARDMEIHCAGPDKMMWTADDLVISSK